VHTSHYKLNMVVLKNVKWESEKKMFIIISPLLFGFQCTLIHHCKINMYMTNVKMLHCINLNC
jgi:hypothetical protein